MSRGMVAFLTGLGGGYLKADQQRGQNDRQDKQDAQNKQLFDARMQDITAAQDARREESDFKAANIAALSGGKQDTGYQVTDTAGSNAFTKDSGAASMMNDMAAAKNPGAMTADATRVSTGATGSTMRGTAAGNQVFTDPAKAQAFAGTQAMSEYAKLQARKDVADQYGKMDLSDDIRGKLTKLESEGAFKAFALAQSGDLEGAAKAYESTGNGRMPKGSKFAANEVVDPVTGTKSQVISIVGAKGEVIVPNLDQALRAYLSPSERYSQNRGDRQDAQGQANWQQSFDLTKLKGENDEKYRARLLSIQGAQEERAQAVHKIAMNDAKIPAAVKMQATALAEEMKSISTAINKAMAEDRFDPKSDNAQALLAQQTTNRNRYSELMRPYTPGAGTSTDKYGLSGDAPSASTGAKNPPASPVIDKNVPPVVPPTRPAQPTYVPPADSPAGQFSARQDAARTASMEKLVQTQQAATSAAAQAIQSGDPRAALAAQDMDGFGALPIEIKQQIRKLVFGR
jgi:hypothetical protein